MKMNLEWVLGTESPKNGTYGFVLIEVNSNQFFFSTGFYSGNEWMLDTNMMDEGDKYLILAYSIIDRNRIASMVDKIVEECKKKEMN